MIHVHNCILQYYIDRAQFFNTYDYLNIYLNVVHVLSLNIMPVPCSGRVLHFIFFIVTPLDTGTINSLKTAKRYIYTRCLMTSTAFL